MSCPVTILMALSFHTITEQKYSYFFSLYVILPLLHSASNSLGLNVDIVSYVVGSQVLYMLMENKRVM